MNLFFIFWEKLTRPFFGLKLFFGRLKRYEYEVNRYYHNSLFKLLDLRLKQAYQRCSPFDISASYQKLYPDKKNLYLYGETPLSVYELWATKWGLCERSVFLELGSGSGRGLFFLSSFFQCKCIGIEWVKEYADLFLKIAKYYQLKDVYLMHGDLLTQNYPKADFIYLFGSCLNAEQIDQVAKALKEQPDTVKIITVSYPLSFYDKAFQTIDQIEAEFEFGKTTLYLNSPKDHFR